jgi:hypothetical protein
MDTGYWILDTWICKERYFAENLIINKKCPKPNLFPKAPAASASSIQHQVSSIKYPASSVKYPVSNITLETLAASASSI